MIARRQEERQEQQQQAQATQDALHLHQRRERTMQLINTHRRATGSPLLDCSQESIALVDR